MVEVSRYADNLAREVAARFGTPVLVVAGEAFKASLSGNLLKTVEFLGYVGSAANFSVLPSDSGIRICDVRVVERPKVAYGKMQSPGEAEILSCEDVGG